MKAAVLYGNEDIRCAEVETPEAGPGQVRVKVKATGICGSDVPRVLKNGAHFYPIILGHEFSGIVDTVGEGVTTVKSGDRVTGAPLLPCFNCEDCQRGNYSLCKHYKFIGSSVQGSFGEYVVMPEINAVKFDDSIPFKVGAMFEPSTVGLHGLLQNDYRGGEYVAILGGGTIGLFTAQWARIMGAKKVVVFDIADERLALAHDLGADETINTLEEGFMQKALDITGGKGYRYVFETAGVTTTMQMAFELASNKANVCYIGTPTRDLTFTPKLFENMNRKEFRLTGSWMSYSAPYPGREFTDTAHYFATGALRFDDRLIFKTFPIEQVGEAFALFKNPKDVKGRVMLTFD